MAEQPSLLQFSDLTEAAMDTGSPVIPKFDFNDDFHLERLPTPRTPPASHDYSPDDYATRALPNSPPPSECGFISNVKPTVDPNHTLSSLTTDEGHRPLEHGRPPTPPSLNGDIGNSHGYSAGNNGAAQARPMTNAERLQKMQEMRLIQMQKRDSPCSLERKPRVKKTSKGRGKEPASSVERTAKGKGKAKARSDGRDQGGNLSACEKKPEEERENKPITPTWRGSGVMTPAQEYSECIVVDVGDREEPYLLVCLKQSQGFAWNTDDLLPRYIRSSNSRDNLEKKPDPIADIVLPDEAKPETSPLPSWCFE